MTPQEKAKDLYNAYKKALNIQRDMRPGSNPFAIDCALIAVDHTMRRIKRLLSIEGIEHSTNNIIVTEYRELEEVKTELQKMKQ